MAAANLPVTIIKGHSFARLIYPAAKLRPFTDIDLLVSPDAVPAINAILNEQGFRLAAHDNDPQRQAAKWVHRDSPLLIVEVCTNLVHHPELRASLSLSYDDIGEGPETPAAQLTIALMRGALHGYERLQQVVDICQAARHLAARGDEAQFERMMHRRTICSGRRPRPCLPAFPRAALPGNRRRARIGPTQDARPDAARSVHPLLKRSRQF